MTESMTRIGVPHLHLTNPINEKKEKKRKTRPIGVVQLVDVLRVLERQLPIVMNSNIDKDDKEYLNYLVDRAFKYKSRVYSNDIGM